MKAPGETNSIKQVLMGHIFIKKKKKKFKKGVDERQISTLVQRNVVSGFLNYR